MEAHLVRLNQDLVLDITQDCTSQDSRTFKLQKGEFKLCEAWPIKNCSKSNSTKFKSGSSPRKRLRFQSNTYKSYHTKHWKVNNTTIWWSMKTNETNHLKVKTWGGFDLAIVKVNKSTKKNWSLQKI